MKSLNSCTGRDCLPAHHDKSSVPREKSYDSAVTDNAIRPDRRSLRILLLLAILLILYGSLYPFRFTASRQPFLQFALPGGLSSIRDIAINLFLYFPAGFLLFHAPGDDVRQGTRFAFALIVSCLLSAFIEIMQAYDIGRFSSAADLAVNVAGAVCGAVAARVFSFVPGARFPVTLWFRRDPGAFLLLASLIAAHLFPFFPRVHLPQYQVAWYGFFTSAFDPVTVVLSTLEWLAVRLLLCSVLRRSAVTLEFSFLLLVIPSGFGIVDQWPAPTELVGALLALAIGQWWQAPPRRFSIWLVLALVLRELSPFHWSAAAHPFHWVPFAGFLEMIPLSVGLLLKKCFLYGSTLWVLDPERRHGWVADATVAILLFFLELVQQHLPGRTPEITDALLVILMGRALSLSRYGILPVTARDASLQVAQKAFQ